MTVRKSNTKSKDFYVYLHRKANTGEVFYVGKGKGWRAFDKTNGRSIWWKNTVEKHGYTIEFYATGLQEWYALELEIELIAYYGRLDNGTGCLVNLTDGGDTLSGYIQSEDHKRKIREKTTGKKRSEETKIKISEIHKGKKLSEEHIRKIIEYRTGKSLSLDTKLKIGISNSGKTRSDELKNHLSIKKSIPIECSNGMKFKSAKSAATWLRENGFPKAGQGTISRAVRGESKTAYGYKWWKINPNF